MSCIRIRLGASVRPAVLAVAAWATLWCSHGASAATGGAETPPPSTIVIAPIDTWRSAPNLLDRFAEADLTAVSRSTPPQTFEQVSRAVVVTDAPDRAGRLAAMWSHLPSVPTIHTTAVPLNWCGQQALSMKLYSSANRGEVITVGVANNAAADPKAFNVNDYFLASIRIDWTGWKRVNIPLADFRMFRRSEKWKTELPLACGQNASTGWDHVGGLYLFSKLWNQQPHPQTEIGIRNVWIGAPQGTAATLVPFGDYPYQHKTAWGVDIGGGPVGVFDPAAPPVRWWNHADAEVAADVPLASPTNHQAYYKHERALLGYFPRYAPGTVSFTPQGVPAVFAGGNAIQYAQSGGAWQMINLENTITEYAVNTLHFGSFTIGNRSQADDSSIRFDNDGDIYVLRGLSDIATGARAGLLLHKSVKRPGWDVYPLPTYFSHFEKFVGHNVDAFVRPPVVALTSCYGCQGTPISLLLPEKNADGTLTLGSQQAISATGNDMLPHSGEATQMLSAGDNVYVAYGEPQFNVEPTSPDAAHGLPTYVRVFNRSSKTFSSPVLIGYGGSKSVDLATGKLNDDAHNWPAIAIDSSGVLHAVINGHNQPFVYVKSLYPYDATRWTAPETAAFRTSYLGLVIDKQNTLHSVCRDSYGNTYRLNQVTRRVGGGWEQKDLFIPDRWGYNIFFHKLTIDPLTDRLFLSTNSQPSQIAVKDDEIEMLLYQRPDFAPSTLNTDGSLKYPGAQLYQIDASDEPAVITSADGGATWRMALSSDLQAPPGCLPDANLRCQAAGKRRH
jgi:hypothetical protein